MADAAPAVTHHAHAAAATGPVPRTLVAASAVCIGALACASTLLAYYATLAVTLIALVREASPERVDDGVLAALDAGVRRAAQRGYAAAASVWSDVEADLRCLRDAARGSPALAPVCARAEETARLARAAVAGWADGVRRRAEAKWNEHRDAVVVARFLIRLAAAAINLAATVLFNAAYEEVKIRAPSVMRYLRGLARPPPPLKKAEEAEVSSGFEFQGITCPDVIVVYLVCSMDLLLDSMGTAGPVQSFVVSFVTSLGFVMLYNHWFYLPDDDSDETDTDDDMLEDEADTDDEVDDEADTDDEVDDEAETDDDMVDDEADTDDGMLDDEADTDDGMLDDEAGTDDDMLDDEAGTTGDMVDDETDTDGDMVDDETDTAGDMVDEANTSRQVADDDCGEGEAGLDADLKVRGSWDYLRLQIILTYGIDAFLLRMTLGPRLVALALLALFNLEMLKACRRIHLPPQGDGEGAREAADGGTYKWRCAVMVVLVASGAKVLEIYLVLGFQLAMHSFASLCFMTISLSAEEASLPDLEDSEDEDGGEEGTGLAGDVAGGAEEADEVRPDHSNGNTETGIEEAEDGSVTEQQCDMSEEQLEEEQQGDSSSSSSTGDDGWDVVEVDPEMPIKDERDADRKFSMIFPWKKKKYVV